MLNQNSCTVVHGNAAKTFNWFLCCRRLNAPILINSFFDYMIMFKPFSSYSKHTIAANIQNACLNIRWKTKNSQNILNAFLNDVFNF